MKIWTFANDWKVIVSYYYPIASILQIVTFLFINDFKSTF
jgi:hypothetical protein